jgi:hypothetical protein
VRNLHSKLVLDVACASKENGAAILQYSEHGGDNQLFRYEEKEGGYGLLRNVHSQLVLDVACGSKENGAFLLQYADHGGANQLFCFEHDS